LAIYTLTSGGLQVLRRNFIKLACRSIERATDGRQFASALDSIAAALSEASWDTGAGKSNIGDLDGVVGKASYPMAALAYALLRLSDQRSLLEPPTF
jgi:hypothetical protein